MARSPKCVLFILSSMGLQLTNSDDLVIHAAIMGPNDARAERLVEYLIKTHPASLEAKDIEGLSPLALATYLGRLNLVKILIAHGADQSTKDKNWNNLVHQAISLRPTVSDLSVFLDLLDPELRKFLLKERSSLQGSDGRTPLHRWMGDHKLDFVNDVDHDIAKLRLFLRFSDRQELEALDGGGDSPLHTIIRNKAHPALIREVIQMNPMLLFRENAVGCTPAEMALDMFVRACVQAPPDGGFRGRLRGRTEVDTLLMKQTAAFGLDEECPLDFGDSGAQDDLSLIRQIHDLVNEFVSTRPGKRRLASLNEANDVARRIGESYQGQRYGWKRSSGRKSRKLRANQGPEHGELEGEEASSEEDQVGTGDFVALTLPNLYYSAWEEPGLVYEDI